MRLKRTLNRHVEGKPYYRWLIADVPRQLLEDLGWGQGDELEATKRGDAILIRRQG